MDLFTSLAQVVSMPIVLNFFMKKFNKLPSLQPTSNTVISFLLLKYLLTEEVRSPCYLKHHWLNQIIMT